MMFCESCALTQGFERIQHTICWMCWDRVEQGWNWNELEELDEAGNWMVLRKHAVGEACGVFRWRGKSNIRFLYFKPPAPDFRCLNVPDDDNCACPVTKGVIVNPIIPRNGEKIFSRSHNNSPGYVPTRGSRARRAWRRLAQYQTRAVDYERVLT